jgi:hypothetical protein
MAKVSRLDASLVIGCRAGQELSSHALLPVKLLLLLLLLLVLLAEW